MVRHRAPFCIVAMSLLAGAAPAPPAQQDDCPIDDVLHERYLPLREIHSTAWDSVPVTLGATLANATAVAPIRSARTPVRIMTGQTEVAPAGTVFSYVRSPEGYSWCNQQSIWDHSPTMFCLSAPDASASGLVEAERYRQPGELVGRSPLAAPVTLEPLEDVTGFSAASVTRTVTVVAIEGSRVTLNHHIKVHYDGADTERDSQRQVNLAVTPQLNFGGFTLHFTRAGGRWHAQFDPVDYTYWATLTCGGSQIRFKT